MSELTKIYVTKYALTTGIFEVDAKVLDGMASYKRGDSYLMEFAHRDEFHLTREAAVAKAEEIRIKKLKSLNKQIKKISAIKF